MTEPGSPDLESSFLIILQGSQPFNPCPPMPFSSLDEPVVLVNTHISLNKQGLAQRLASDLIGGSPIQLDLISKPQQLRGGAGIPTAPTGQICRNPSNQRHRGAAQHLRGFWGHCGWIWGQSWILGPEILIFPALFDHSSVLPGL